MKDIINISIIIPTFNRGKFLSESLDSLINQDELIHEIIIVDDCSSDNTGAVVSQFEKLTTSNIVFTRNDVNKGAQYCRNKGIEISRGTHIIFLDSDDVLFKHVIKKLYSKVTNEYDYIYFQVLRSNELLQPTSLPIGHQWNGNNPGIADYNWHTMGAIYKKDYVEKIGGWNPELKGSQDWEFQARIKMGGGRGLFLPLVVGLWRDHEGPRIGTKRFNDSYVDSVVKATLSIKEIAQQNELLDKELKLKLTKKLFFHALEYSVNDYSSKKQYVLKKINGINGNDNKIYNIIFNLFQLTPKLIDIVIFRFLIKKKALYK